MLAHAGSEMTVGLSADCVRCCVEALHDSTPVTEDDATGASGGLQGALAAALIALSVANLSLS